MPDKNIFSERERALEDEYFIKKERELVDKMRAKVAREEDRKLMAEATGVADQEVLEALQDLGYSAATVKLLYIVPLIEVAWAEGGVSDKERELILNIAKTREIIPGTPAYDQLIDWLHNEPPQEFYENTMRAARYMIEALPDRYRKLSRESLVEYCIQIAEVSGGILGFGKISDEERASIAKIADLIGQGREGAVKKIIEG